MSENPYVKNSTIKRERDFYLVWNEGHDTRGEDDIESVLLAVEAEYITKEQAEAVIKGIEALRKPEGGG